MSRGFVCVKISIYRGNPEEGTIPKFFFFSCPHSFARRRLYFSEVLYSAGCDYRRRFFFCFFACFRVLFLLFYNRVLLLCANGEVAFFQDFVDEAEEYDGGDDSSDEVGNGFGVKYAFHTEEAGQGKGQCQHQH